MPKALALKAALWKVSKAVREALELSGDIGAADGGITVALKEVMTMLQGRVDSSTSHWIENDFRYKGNERKRTKKRTAVFHVLSVEKRGQQETESERRTRLLRQEQELASGEIDVHSMLRSDETKPKVKEINRELSPNAREKYIITLKFRGAKLRCLLDTGSNVTLLDKRVAQQHGWKCVKEDIDLCYASKEVQGTAHGYLLKDGNLTGGQTDVRVTPLIVDLAASDYDMIVGNRELLRMGIVLSGLPSPTSLKDEDLTHIDHEQFKNSTGVDAELMWDLTKQLEDLLNVNKSIPFTDRCNADGAVVHLNITEDQVRYVRSSKRNFVAQAYEEAVTKTVKDWLAEGTIA